MMSVQSRAPTGQAASTHGEGSAKRVDPPKLGPGPPSQGWMPEDFVTEADAYAAYGHVLEDKELRNARYAGRIGFMRRKRTIFYRRDELEAFVSGLLRQDYVEPCTRTSRSAAKPTASTFPLSHRTTTSQDRLDPEHLRLAHKLLT